MNQDKRNRLDDMLIALSEVSADEVSAERAQLSKEGINFSKLDDGIKSIMTPPKAQKHSWLKAAKEKRAKVNDAYEAVKNKIKVDPTKISEIVAAIKAGSYGDLPQQKLAAQFRNKGSSSITEVELIELLKDCDLLKILNEGSND